MLIVGLGNPTKEYENTFHNIGYLTIDALAKRLGKKIIKAECKSLTSVKTINGEKVVLAKPYTYMNLSGCAVKELMAKYKQQESDLLVIVDDIDIPRFSVRTRPFGSAGTHNGMKNIVDMIGTSNFKRMRIGIGQQGYDLASYVLSKIPSEDRKTFDATCEKVSLLLEQYIMTKDFDKLSRESNVINKC
ncbi:MAG TPA: aminoacyl-tRNA hydrolase [Clostridia bacterium]|nr:aminoacyl-tRNA hydrolase [Clostridia bacterium]